jgi:hypothetical protein
MSLEHAFFLSQIIASIAVVASLIFVGHQVRENTLAIQRTPSLPMSKRYSLPMNRRRERPHPSGPLQKARARKR